MLLSFPLNPDPIVMEIISDSVYANSSTLDGRRFAQEFVAKRKADAKAQKAGTVAPVGRGSSLADSTFFLSNRSRRLQMLTRCSPSTCSRQGSAQAHC